MRESIYNTYNNHILNLISQSKNILDVGCGTGLFAEEIKKKQNCFIVGIEKNPHSAGLATKRCDKVIMGDIEELSQFPFSPEYFDCIILADILEHTKNPEKVLDNIKPYLSKNGFIFISVPNVAHWRMRIQLLFGKFDYQERGALDRTHLRFFTLKTFRKLLQGSSLEIISLSGKGNFLANILKGPFASFFVAKVRYIKR